MNVYERVRAFVRVCESLVKVCVSPCESMSECVRVCGSLYESVGECESLRECVRVCESVSESM